MTGVPSAPARFIVSRRVTRLAAVALVATAIGGAPVALDALAPTSAAAALVQDVDALRREARSAAAAGRWDAAVDAWTSVLDRIPGDEEAQQGLEQARVQLDMGSSIGDVEQDLAIRRQRALAEFRQRLDEARAEKNAGSFDAAERSALTAKVGLDRARSVLDPDTYESRADEVEALIDEISEARITAELVRVEEERLAAEQAADAQRQQEAAARQRQINESLVRVRQLQQQFKYDEALQVLEQILFIDPLNNAALALRDVIQTSQLYRQQVDTRREIAFRLYNLTNENLRSAIPPTKNIDGPGDKSTTGLMSYPEDWPQLSLRRDGAGGYQEPGANLMVRQRLEEPVTVNFSKNTFEQVVNYMKNVTEVEVYADWRALGTIGVTRDDEVNLALRNVSAGTALKRILEQLGDDLERPHFAVEDGTVVVSTERALRQRMVTVVYDIRDLLLEVPYFDNAPDFSLGTAISTGVRRGGDGAFGNEEEAGEGFADPVDRSGRRTRDDLVEEIIRLIQSTIDPERGWVDTSGEGGTIQELNGNLIVRNTPRNHREIDGLLEQLREIRALQINVETRLLNVTLEWFEQIGVDLDLYFNTNNDMYRAAKQIDPTFQLSDFFNPGLPGGGRAIPTTPIIFDDLNGSNGFEGPGVRTLTPTGFTPGNGFITPNGYGALPGGGPPPTDLVYQFGGGFPGAGVGGVGRERGWDPIAFSQDSLGLVRTVGSNFFEAGTFAAAALANPALAVGISFLDDIQVDLLVEATQADQRNVILTAPRLTLFNGQRSWISVARGITYVADLTPVTGDASGAFDPQTGVVYEGFVLDIEGVISADRRYVTMTVAFGLNENVSFNAVDVSGAAGGGDFGGGRSSQFTGQIQLPTLQGTSIRTTVSVPDRGTVLLGGQRTVNEFEVEAGVPVLSKIPIVNRFFTNRLNSKQETTTLLLIRPEIIIQQENENILFPGLSDQLGGGSSYLGY